MSQQTNQTLFTHQGPTASKEHKATRFSVVIPLYNKVNDIRNTLQSVLNQTHKPYEIIVVDDGSTDGSDLLVELDFCQRDSNNIRLIRQHNAGVSVARNTGIACATGEYIAFIDADDSWSVHFLEELNTLANRHPDLAMLATAYQYQLGETNYRQPKIRQRRKARTQMLKTQVLGNYFDVASRGDLPFCASSVAIKKEFFDAHGCFPNGERMGEDQCMWSRVALKSAIAYSPRGLSFYNVAADNRACLSAPPAEECPFSIRLQTYAMNNNSLSDQDRKAILRYTAAHRLHLAEQNIRAGHWDLAKELIDDQRCALKPAKRIKTQLKLTYTKILSVIRKKTGAQDRMQAYGW